jgi:Family of unknown function (DUF5994)
MSKDPACPPGRARDMALAVIQDTKPTPASALQSGPDAARLSLDPAGAKRTGINGGWWPRGRDAGAELPGLIAELNERAGRISRVALQVSAFANIPHELTVGGRKVHVAWFRYMNVHSVILTMASGDDLVLLVVPAGASPVAAAEALQLAASGWRAGPPEAILAAACIPTDGDGNLSGNGAD